MSPLNHKRTSSSLAPPTFYVAKKFCNKKIESFPLQIVSSPFAYFSSIDIVDTIQTRKRVEYEIYYSIRGGIKAFVTSN